MQRRIATRALIYRPGECSVLLGQRSNHDTSSPGKWALLGGEVDPYETPRESVIREVREEGGVTFLPEFTYHVHTNDKWKTYFIVGSITGELNFNPDEHQGGRYIEDPELDQIELAFDHKIFIRGFLRSLG